MREDDASEGGTASRARAEAGETSEVVSDERRAFGAFATLPSDVVVRVLGLVDGWSLASCACACKDFNALIRANEETLWRNALVMLEGESRMREDLVKRRGKGKFPPFTWRELYGWRVHTLKLSAQTDARTYSMKNSKIVGELDGTVSSREGFARGRSSSIKTFTEGGYAVDVRARFSLQGRLAVIDQDRLFTCDPISRGGIMINIHETTKNAFIARTLTWSPNSELLGCAFTVEGADTNSSHCKIVLAAPRKYGRGRYRTFTTDAEGFEHKKARVDGSYDGPPINNILALPRGLRCSHMAFSPCGTFINFLHTAGPVRALYALDCATSITSLYGPSNGIAGESPVPMPAEKVKLLASGSEDLRFSPSPNDRNVALMLTSGETSVIDPDSRFEDAVPMSTRWSQAREFNETEVSGNDDSREQSSGASDEEHVPDSGARSDDGQNKYVDASEDDVPIESAFKEDTMERLGRDFGEVISSERTSWLQQMKGVFNGGIKLLASAAFKTSDKSTGTSTQEISPGSVAMNSSLRTSSIATSSDSGTHQSCRRGSSWWSNIPNFRVMAETNPAPLPKQPLARAFGRETLKPMQWIPSERDDRKGRGFWLIPASLMGRSRGNHLGTYLAMAPVPSRKAILQKRIMPFIDSDDSRLFENIDSCVITEVPLAERPEPLFVGNIQEPFCFSGQPGGRHVVWSTADGVFIRRVRFDLDADGDWTGPPTLGPTMTVLDIASVMTGLNQWTKAYDELSVRNYAAWNGTSGIPLLSVANEVAKHTVELLHWSPSGDRLLILLASHIVHDIAWNQNGPNPRERVNYTVHQWLCWDPAPNADEAGIPMPESSPHHVHSVLSVGSRFVASGFDQSFGKAYRDGIERLSQGLNLWSPEETAVAFPLQVASATTTASPSSYIVIQHFERVDFAAMKERSARGEIPPLRQPDAFACHLPHYLNFVRTPLEYVCEGTHCSWSPT